MAEIGQRSSAMFLLLLILLLLMLFAGLGFVVHVLWWGLVIGVIIAIAHVVSGGLSRAGRRM